MRYSGGDRPDGEMSAAVVVAVARWKAVDVIGNFHSAAVGCSGPGVAFGCLELAVLVVLYYTY